MSSNYLEESHLFYVDVLDEWVKKNIEPQRVSLSILKDKSLKDKSSESSPHAIFEPKICDRKKYPDYIARDPHAKLYGNLKNFYLIGEAKTANDFNDDKKRKFEQINVYFYHLQKKAKRDNYDTLLLYALPDVLHEQANTILSQAKKSLDAKKVNFKVIGRSKIS